MYFIFYWETEGKDAKGERGRGKRRMEQRVVGLSLYEFRDGLWCEVKKGHFALDPNFDVLLWSHASLVAAYFQTMFIPKTVTWPERPGDPPKLEKGSIVTIEDLKEQLIKHWKFMFVSSFESAGGKNGESAFAVFSNKMMSYIVLIGEIVRMRFMEQKAKEQGSVARATLAKRREGDARTLLQARGRDIVRYLLGMVSGDKANVRTRAGGVKYPSKTAIFHKIANEVNGMLAHAVEVAIAAQRKNFKKFTQWSRDARLQAEAFGQTLNEMVLNRRIR
jgi:hypothetical protein